MCPICAKNCQEKKNFCSLYLLKMGQEAIQLNCIKKLSFKMIVEKNPKKNQLGVLESPTTSNF